MTKKLIERLENTIQLCLDAENSVKQFKTEVDATVFALKSGIKSNGSRAFGG